MIAYDLKDIHAAKSLAKYCEKFDFEIDAIYGRYVVDAKSVMGLIDLVGHVVELRPHCDRDKVVSFTNDIKNI